MAGCISSRALNLIARFYRIFDCSNNIVALFDLAKSVSFPFKTCICNEFDSKATVLYIY